jgi:hypothetical protein
MKLHPTFALIIALFLVFAIESKENETDNELE